MNCPPKQPPRNPYLNAVAPSSNVCESVPPPVSPINNECIEIRDALDHLEKSLACLYEKISPALHKDAEASGALLSNEVSATSGCDLTDRLSGFKYRIRRLAQEVINTTERCHL